MKSGIGKYRVELIGGGVALVLLVVNLLLSQAEWDQYHPWPALSGFFQAFLLVFLLMRRALRGKKVFVFNLVLFAGLLLATEFACFLLLGMPPVIRNEYKVPNLPPQHIAKHLGQVPHSGKTMKGLMVQRGDTIFDVDYEIDQHCRRITPGFDSSRTKYALFFGCSVCFGFGLEGDQTLPYHFQQASGYNAYNYGYSGYGSHHMLARFEHKDLSKQVREKDGVAIYVFIAAHFRRNIGSMRIYTQWGHTAPYYHHDSEGKLVRDGNFQTGRPWRNWMYVLLNRSSFFRYFDIGMPIFLSRSHLELTADIIAQSRERYREQFGNDRFYVLFHPMSFEGASPENLADLKLLLQERGIAVLDYSTRIELDSDHRIHGDPHPNERTYREVTDLLMRDLELD